MATKNNANSLPSMDEILGSSDKSPSGGELPSMDKVLGDSESSKKKVDSAPVAASSMYGLEAAPLSSEAPSTSSEPLPPEEPYVWDVKKAQKELEEKKKAQPEPKAISTIESKIPAQTQTLQEAQKNISEVETYKEPTAEEKMRDKVIQAAIPYEQRLAGLFARGATKQISDASRSVAILAKKMDFFGSYDDKKVDELATYKFADWLEKTVQDLTPTDRAMQESLTGKLAEGAGGLSGYVAGGMTGKALKGTSFLGKSAEWVIPAMMGAGQNGSQEYKLAYDRATDAQNLSDEEYINKYAKSEAEIPAIVAQKAELAGKNPEDVAWDIGVPSFAFGALEGLPISRFFSRVDKATGGWGKKVLGKKIGENVDGFFNAVNDSRVAAGVMGGMEEAAQEMITQGLTNAAAGKVYDTTRNIYEGLAESGELGGILGFALNAMGVSIRKMRSNPELKPEQAKELDATLGYIEKQQELIEGVGPTEIIKPIENSDEVNALEAEKNKLISSIGNENVDAKAASVIKQEVDKIDEQIQKTKEAERKTSIEEDIKQIELNGVEEEISSLEKALAGKLDESTKILFESKLQEAQKTKEQLTKTKTDESEKTSEKSGEEIGGEKESVSEVVQAEDGVLEPETGVAQGVAPVISEEVVEEPMINEPSIVESYKTEREAKRATDKKAAERAERAKQDLSIPEETLKDKFLTAVQDRMRRLDVMQKSAKKEGVNISDELDAYTKYELMTSKGKNQIMDKWNEVVESKPKQEKALLERLKEEGGNIDELGLYMMAKHAPERNAHIAKIRGDEYNSKREDLLKKINTATENGLTEKADDLTAKLDILEANTGLMEDGGSGMTNAEAAKVIEELEANGKTEALEKYSKEFREKVIKPNLDNLKKYGLIDSGLHDLLSNYYKDYVPLVAESKAAKKTTSTGRSMDVKGKDIKKSKGSDIVFGDRVNPVTSSLFNFATTTMRGEKNIADQSFLDLVKEVGGDEFKVVEPETVLEYNSFGEPEYVVKSAKPESLSKSLEFRVDGKPVFIEIKDPALLEAMKGLGVRRSIPILRSVNSFLRGINTVYNPEFIFTNFTRDIQTALINASATEVDGIKRKLVKNISNSMKGIWQNERGIKSEWSDIVDDFKKQGADMSFWEIGEMNDFDKELNKKINKYNSSKTSDNLKGALNSMLGYWSAANRAVELGSRVSAYKAAIDSGVSKQKAAQVAKNLTVNFEKKGNFGLAIDSLYLFANAGIQGSAIMMKNLSKSPKMRAVATGLVAASILLAELNRLINEEAYEEVDEGIKDRNLIFMKPDGSYLKFPLPYGFNLFKVLGDNIDSIINGEKNALEGGKDLLLSINSAFNPINSSTLAQSVSPTISDPLVQVSENKNWFGGQIYKEDPPYSPATKEGAKYFNSVRPLTKDITDKINKVTGGNEIKSGYVDINPEIADHFVDYMGGGVGRFVGNIVSGTRELAEGEIPKINSIPFARSFYANAPEYADAKIVYDYSKEAYHKLYDKKQRERFDDSLKDMLDKKEIDKDEYNKKKEDFYKGQSMIEFSEKYDLSKFEVLEFYKLPEARIDKIKKNDDVKKFIDAFDAERNAILESGDFSKMDEDEREKSVNNKARNRAYRKLYPE